MSLNRSLAELLCERASKSGARLALIDASTGLETSYEALLKSALSWAAWFRAAPLPFPRRIAAALPNSVTYAQALCGAALAPVGVLPLNPSFTDAQLAALSTRFGAGAILVPPHRAEAMRAATTLPVVSVGRTGELPSGLPPPGPQVEVPPDTECLLILTSGTTGGIKACRLVQNRMAWTSSVAGQAFGAHENRRYLTPLPLFHMNAQVIGLWTSIQAGGALGLAESLPASKLWEAAALCRAEGMSTVPTLLRDLLARDGKPPECLKFMVTSSAPLAADTHAQLLSRFGVEVRHCYGMSETSGFIAFTKEQDSVPLGSCGRALGYRVKVVDDTGAEVSSGTTGAILVQGPGLMTEYVGDESATAATIQNGWLRTGDVGFVDASGAVFLRAREKDLINRGGEKIAPVEIEEVIAKHPSVAEVCVFSVPDARYGEAVAAAIVTREGASANADALVDFALEHLSEFQVPEHWHFMPALPKGGTGKVLRRVLCEQFK